MAKAKRKGFFGYQLETRGGQRISRHLYWQKVREAQRKYPRSRIVIVENGVPVKYIS